VKDSRSRLVAGIMIDVGLSTLEQRENAWLMLQGLLADRPHRLDQSLRWCAPRLFRACSIRAGDPHPCETFYSQVVPLRFGNHILKMAVAPSSGSRWLLRRRRSTSMGPDGLGEAAVNVESSRTALHPISTRCPSKCRYGLAGQEEPLLGNRADHRLAPDRLEYGSLRG
jgi:hypothetical protein